MREILAGYLKSRKLYDEYKREAEELETLMTSVGIDYSRIKVQTSRTNDRWADIIDRLIELHESTIAQMEETLTQRQKIAELIDSIHEPQEHEILFRRWIKGESMEGIAAAMHHDVRWIYRLHKRALKELTDHVQAMRPCV